MKKIILWINAFFFFIIGINSVLMAQNQNFNNASVSPQEVYRNARVYVENMFNGENQLALGAKMGVLFEFGRKGRSGYRYYVSGAIAKNFSKGSIGTILNYQLDLVLFTNGIGSSILPSERNKSNFELRNNLGFVIGGNDNNYDKIWGRPLNASLGDAVSVLEDPLDISVQFGTVFVTGINHKRNQQLGFLKVGFKPFHFYYMNDGPPFGKIGLGDTWDRFWTGVGGIGYYQITPNGEITSMEIRYSRYTGDEPFLYDLSSDMRMNYLPQKDGSTQFFNKGRYQYRIGFRNSIYAGLNIYQPKITDVQRIIHYGEWALHPNTTDRYFSVFGQYSFKHTYLNN
jgi:hypothetical protein